MAEKTVGKGARLLAFGLIMAGLVTVVAFLALTGLQRSRTGTTEHTTGTLPSSTDGGTVEVVRIQVEGMTCGGCATNVATELEKVDGVETCTVDLEGRTAEVRLTRSDVSTETLLAAIETAGYSARLAP